MTEMKNTKSITKNCLHTHELSKTQKLQATGIAIASGLVLYAVGIATFFQNPIFSMFWIVNSQVALDAIFVATATAIILSAFLSLTFLKKTEVAIEEIADSTFIRTTNTSSEAPAPTIQPVDNQKIESNPESDAPR